MRTLLLLVLLLPACREAAERVFRPPEARLRGVKFGAMGLGGGSLEIVLAVRNPNPYRLTASGAHYRLLVQDSVEVGRGVSADTFTVAANDTGTVRLPLDVEWSGLRRALRDATRDGEVEYRVVGDLRAQTPLGGYDVPLDARGRTRVPTLFH